MTNVRRPIHLHLRPASSTPPTMGSPKALSPAADSVPSQILPHLFVGAQEQTNRETLNRLGISYILSLGLLPLVSSSVSPTSPTSQQQQPANNKKQQQQHHRKHQQHHNNQPQHHQISMPSRNSSKDFKIRIRTTNTSATQTPQTPTLNGLSSSLTAMAVAATTTTSARDENKGVKQIRWIQCKCINIADHSEQMLSKFFDEAHQFIDEARRRKCNILVHCQAGISRSPTIAIAYLMRVNSLPLQEAYNLVKQCRPQTDPNLSFMGQLMIYEKSLEAGSSSATKQQHQQQATSQQQPQQQQRKSVTQDTKLS